MLGAIGCLPLGEKRKQRQRLRCGVGPYGRQSTTRLQRAFGHGYRAALIEINGSRNFRHIPQALRGAQRAACLALPRGYRPRGRAAREKAASLCSPLAAIDGHRWLPQLFHHPGRKYCLVRYRSLGQGWNNQHAANRASPATGIAFSKATLLSVNKVLTCVNGDRIVHDRQTRNFFVGSSIGNQMFAPALSLVGHTCSI